MGQIWDKTSPRHVGRHRAPTTRQITRRALIRLTIVGILLATAMGLAADEPAALVGACWLAAVSVVPVWLAAVAIRSVRGVGRLIGRILPLAVLGAVVGCGPSTQPAGAPAANLPAAPSATAVHLGPFEGGR